MKNLWIPIIIVLFAFGYWFNRYPAFKPKGIANITISDGDSNLYQLDSINPKSFKYYLKKEPKKIEFTYDNKTVILREHKTHYKVTVEYINKDLGSIIFN